MSKNFVRKTGGVKEFHYTSEDLKRMGSEDTPSTKEFKEKYREWLAKQEYKKEHPYKYWWEKNSLQVTVLLIIFFVLGLLAFLYFFVKI